MNKWKTLIQCGETSTLQFKRGEVRNDSLAAELVALANSKGGAILFGIGDKEGTAVGLTYEEVQRISNQVANVANSMVHPTIYVETETTILDDKIILIVSVGEGYDKPYKDQQGSIWVKQGADKRHITENTEILRLFSLSKKYYPDEEGVARTSLADLDDRKIDAYLDKVYGKGRNDFGLPFDALMRNMRIATDEGELTLGGLLYFGRDPQLYRPNFCIKAVSFFGNEIGGTEYRDSRDIIGTIPEMFEEAMRFLNGNLHHVQAGQSFNSVGILEISRVALEEIVQNALCHREYIRQAAIRILIFDNRVEIVSPGSLPEGMTVEEMKMGNTAQRNPLICTFCARTMIYRGLGSGIIRAMQEVNDVEFVNQGNQFTIIIRRRELSDKSQGVDTESQRLSDKNQGLNDKLNDKSAYNYENGSDNQRLSDKSQGVDTESQRLSDKNQGLNDKLNDKSAYNYENYSDNQGLSDKSQGVNIKSQGVSDKSDAASDKSQGVNTKSQGVSDKSNAASDKSQGVSDKSDVASDKSQGLATRTDNSKDKFKKKQDAIVAFCCQPRTLQEIAEYFDVTDRYRFKRIYIDEILGTKLSLTEPDSPNSPTQKYIKID